MQFEKGTDVFTAEGEKMGSIVRVVLDPQTNEVTHLVVRKGFLFTKEKLVPIDLVDTTTEDQVFLRDRGDELS